MNCSKAHEYFIKHVDNCISLMESEWLEKHLIKCEKCREDFIAYEAIVNAILEETVDANIAPHDLEMAIMEQIGELSLANKDDDADKSEARLRITFVISFILTMTVAFVIMMRHDALVQLQVNVHGAFIARFGGVSEAIQLSLDSFIVSVYGLSGNLVMLFDRVYLGVLLALMALVFIQLTLWKRDRATQ